MRKLTLTVWLGVGALAIAIGVSAAATPGVEAAQPPATAQDRSRICIAERAGAGTESGWHSATLALVLASTHEPAGVLAELEELLERAEEQTNPMALDLDAEDPAQPKRLRSELWPRVTAAQALVRPELERQGHVLVPCGDPAARYALWREQAALPPATAQQQHQAWPIASLAVVRSGDPERLQARLRDRSAEAGSTIALVVGPLTHVDGLAPLAKRARRLLERAQRAGRNPPPLLALLARATDAGEIPIALGAGDLAVVPRLGALSRSADFAAEIELALGAGDRFVHRPQPISGRNE
jgi:hypothetical protein